MVVGLYDLLNDVFSFLFRYVSYGVGSVRREVKLMFSCREYGDECLVYAFHVAKN